jgi:hypothetical protein
MLVEFLEGDLQCLRTVDRQKPSRRVKRAPDVIKKLTPKYSETVCLSPDHPSPVEINELCWELFNTSGAGHLTYVCGCTTYFGMVFA